MVLTPHLCAACGSEHSRRNGRAAGRAKYQCKACGHQTRSVPAATAAQYARADKLPVERNPRRSVARATGISRMTVTKRLKRAASPAPRRPRLRSRKAQKKRWEALELDELWTFVGRKKRKVWLWPAVERASRRIVAWATMRRAAATARRLWQALPSPPPPKRPPTCAPLS